MTKGALAGLIYFLIVFVAGFGLGTIRVLSVAPHLGETAAVALETPFMLAISWAACGWCLRRFGLGSRRVARASMSAVAFSLLMAAEFGVAVLLFGQSANDFLAGYRAPPGLIGLAAQIVFGVLPLIRATMAPIRQRARFGGA